MRNADTFAISAGNLRLVETYVWLCHAVLSRAVQRTKDGSYNIKRVGAAVSPTITRQFHQLYAVQAHESLAHMNVAYNCTSENERPLQKQANVCAATSERCEEASVGDILDLPAPMTWAFWSSLSSWSMSTS